MFNRFPPEFDSVGTNGKHDAQIITTQKYWVITFSCDTFRNADSPLWKKGDQYRTEWEPELDWHNPLHEHDGKVIYRCDVRGTLETLFDLAKHTVEEIEVEIVEHARVTGRKLVQSRRE